MIATIVVTIKSVGVPVMGTVKETVEKAVEGETLKIVKNNLLIYEEKWLKCWD